MGCFSYIQGIDIKRLLTVIIVSSIIATALILAGIYIYDNVSLEAGGLTGAQKSDSTRIALGDGYIQQTLGYIDNYTIGTVTPVSPDYYSYSNSTVRAIVPIAVKSQYMDDVLMVTVDLDENRTVSILHSPPGDHLYDEVGMDALKILLKDPTIGAMINNSGYTYSFNNQTSYHKDVYIVFPPGLHVNGDYGILNDPSTYMDVSVQVGEMVPIYRTVTATVDNADGQVIIARFQDVEGEHPPSYTAVIKPGAAFYRQYGGCWGHSFANYTIDTGAQGLSTIVETPGTAVTQPIFVDKDNFEKLRNGSSYQALNVTINITDKGWRADIPANTDFYMVLKNDDRTRSAMISLEPRSFFI